MESNNDNTTTDARSTLRAELLQAIARVNRDFRDQPGGGASMKCMECGSSKLEQKLELWVKIEDRDASTLGHANGPLGGDDCYRYEATEAIDYGNYDATQVFWCSNCSDICEVVRA